MHGISQPQRDLLHRILSVYHPALSSSLPGEKPTRPGEPAAAADYLERVVSALELFVPASRPEFGITERGGDAVIAYLGGSGARKPDFFLMLDVSGFTALLTFLTDRFGKQEAGDIMNLGILNRYCLNRIGILLHHFAACQAGKADNPGETALKTALSFRALLGRVTGEVRRELGRKLAGKPHQDQIDSFIKTLEIKASGCVVAAAGGGSDFYGREHRVRITWGETARLVSSAEKLGGSEEKVHESLAECKGVGLDTSALRALESLVESGWLRDRDFALKKFGAFHKLVLTPDGCRSLSRKVEHLFRDRAGSRGAKAEAAAGGPQARPLPPGSRLAEAARRLEKLVPMLYGEEFIGLAVRSLGPEADKAVLFMERSSRIHDTGILFVNFTIDEEGLLDELAEAVHEVMLRYGMMYKYNIFPLGDFNLMATLGLELPGAPETDRFYSEVLWQCWSHLLRTFRGAFGERVGLRAGMSVGKCLQGPVGDNLIHNEHTIIGPDCNLAARLVAQALQRRQGRFVFGSGTLVVTEGCYRPLSHLVQPVEPFTRASLKGFSEPLPLYSAAGRQASESLADFTARLRQLPLATVEGKLVEKISQMSRDGLLRRCLKILEAVNSGRAAGTALLAFHGPGGLGKTRRMAEIMAWCQKQGWKVLFGECLSWYQEARPRQGGGKETPAGSAAVPYHSFIRLLTEQVFGITPQDDHSGALKKIARVLSGLPDSLEAVEQAPVIASFLGLADPQNLPGSLSPEARRNIFFERVADLVEHLISLSGKGLLLCLDDLQWADRETLKLLRFLRQRVERGLVVCVSARKPGQLEALTGGPAGGAGGSAEVLRVDPLGAAAVELLTRIALGVDLGAGLPESLLDRVRGGLENNPFFIIEFCGKLLEKEIAYVRDGSLLRLDEDSLKRIGLPNRIQSVIESRVESLPRRDFELVRYGSVLGSLLHCRHVAVLAGRL
ncbi:MAG: AAA family ATPase, partial [Candidatus Glassbacteria bacterium]|nr:AAA family ATPase [Candidatus Glassbacteria bacterium]